MIKLVAVHAEAGTALHLTFSDGTAGSFDLAPLIARNTPLTQPLTESGFRERCYIEMGALCWPNGLELSAASLHQRMEETGQLQRSSEAA